MTRLGAVGAFLLTFVQPLRVLGVLPLVAAATVVIGVEEASPFAARLARRLLDRTGVSAVMRARLARLAPCAALVLAAAIVMPARFTYVRGVRAELDSFRSDAPCGSESPPGLDARALDGHLRSLGSLGRFWYDDTTLRGLVCSYATGLELAPIEPVASTTGVGVHVGVQQVAYMAPQPERPGSAARAEALGIRDVLLFDGAPAGSEWDILARFGVVTLARRRNGTDIVGVGCITSTWSGSDVALRARLIGELTTDRGADVLLDPLTLVALETSTGEVTERAEPTSECNAFGARVAEIAREPGAHEANVDARAPVDVVFRVAAFPAWRVLVDGQPSVVRMVAPGFVATRIPRGVHHVEAVVSTLPFYVSGILLALAVAAALALCTRANLRRLITRHSLAKVD